MEYTIIGEVAVVKGVCPFCGEVWEVHLPAVGFKKWVDRACIQNAMPDVPAETREFLLSGMCRDCQNKIFEEEEDYVPIDNVEGFILGLCDAYHGLYGEE